MLKAQRPDSTPVPPTGGGASGNALPVLVLLLTGVIWSTSGFLIKLVDWNPAAIAGMRSAIAAVFMVLVMGKPRFTWSPAQIGAGVSIAVTMILFVTANKLTTSANAILLQYTAPIFVAIFASLLIGERTHRHDWFFIFLVLGGMVLFFIDKVSATGFWGNVIAVVSGVTMALFIVLMRMQKDGSPRESLLLGHLISAVVTLPFMFGSFPSVTSWVGIGLMGVVQQGVTSLLFAYGVKHVSAVGTIIISLVEPLLNPLWVFFLLGELPTPNAIAGGLIILVVVTVKSVLSAARGRNGTRT